MVQELTTKPGSPTNDNLLSVEWLSLLELSEIVESIDPKQEDKENREGMRDNNGRWIKY